VSLGTTGPSYACQGDSAVRNNCGNSLRQNGGESIPMRHSRIENSAFLEIGSGFLIFPLSGIRSLSPPARLLPREASRGCKISDFAGETSTILPVPGSVSGS